MTFVVYTLLDGARQPLYVGQTNNLERRLREHRATDMGRNIATVLTIPFATREEALKAEAWRIDKLRPLWNVQHNPRRITVAEAISRHECAMAFRLINGSRAGRHQWLREHPDATARERKWIALRDTQERRSA